MDGPALVGADHNLDRDPRDVQVGIRLFAATHENPQVRCFQIGGCLSCGHELSGSYSENDLPGVTL